MRVTYDHDEIKKELARRKFKNFIQYTKPEYEFNWHHEILISKLQAFAEGKIKRLMIFMPPRHGKSEVASRRLPAWIFGRNPKARIICATYAAELAQSFNRDVQRVIDEHRYAAIFPNTTLNRGNVRSDSTQSWIRNNDVFEIVKHGGMYRCAGVGGAITGTGGDFLIIDDPFKNYEEAMSPTIRRKVWEWYTSTFYTRQEKDAGIMIIQCMTGDTNVLMDDGTQKHLKDISVGDSIKTYENGSITISKIKNWKCCGSDLVYSISTKSGKTVKANERHPFLVSRNGRLEWVRLKELKINEKMIAVKEHGAERSVQCAKKQSSQKDFVSHIITNINGHPDTDRHQSIKNQEELRILNTDTELNYQNTIKNLNNKTEFVEFAKRLLAKSIRLLTGIKNFALITNTKQEKSEDCFATNAICSLNTGTLKKYLKTQSNICEFIHDEIIEIKKLGYENVYDIEVERTANFIANGLVSHNTRWHEDDLSGTLLDHQRKGGEFSDQWEVVNFPAILEKETECDPRQVGDALWPEKYDEKFLKITKHTMGASQFSALYQQTPAPSDGQVIKAKWLKRYDRAPEIARNSEILQSWDMSFGSVSDSASFVVGSVYHKIGSQVYLIDQVRGQWDFTETVAQVRALTAKWPIATRKLIEKKANGQAVIDTVSSEIQGIIPIIPDASKESRLIACQPIYEAGNVLYPQSSDAPWIDEHISEMISFPNAKHDDRVDAESQALNYWREGVIGKMTEEMSELVSANFDSKENRW